MFAHRARVYEYVFVAPENTKSGGRVHTLLKGSFHHLFTETVPGTVGFQSVLAIGTLPALHSGLIRSDFASGFQFRPVSWTETRNQRQRQWNRFRGRVTIYGTRKRIEQL